MPRRTTGGVAAALRTIQLVQSLRDSEQAVEVSEPVRHSTIFELRVMASDRAKLIAPDPKVGTAPEVLNDARNYHFARCVSQ